MNRTAKPAGRILLVAPRRDLCLDFANTHDYAGEHLHAYADLLAFARQSELITPHDARWPQADATSMYSSDSSTIVTAPNDAITYTLWTVSTGAYITTFSVPNSQNYQYVALGPGGHELVLGDGYNAKNSTFSKLYLWDIP